MTLSPAAAADAAARFDAAFQGVYLAFHRRDGRHRELSASSRAVLTHLGYSGPVTIGEATEHLDRSQSVVSEIVTQLERNGLVERRRDDADRRRVLVWLTDSGMDVLRDDASVLSHRRLGAALAELDDEDVEQALTTLHRLITTTERTPS